MIKRKTLSSLISDFSLDNFNETNSFNNSLKNNIIKKNNITLNYKNKPIDEMKILLCGIAKMENHYIREWVEHYKDLGFDNICLFDNNDVDGERFEDVINDYIESGFVILKNARGFYRYQIESYNKCYEEYKNIYDWIAFFDIDEFLMLDEKYQNNIKNFVNDNIFKQYNCIRVCWQNYDDNDLIKVIDGNYNCKERFTRKWNCDYQTKAIVRTVFDKIYNNSPHIMSSKTQFKSCNTLGISCVNSISIGRKETTKNARLNHYRFKTIEEYVLGKMVRLWPTNYGDGGKKMLDLNFFFKSNKKTNEKLEYGKKMIFEKTKKDNEKLSYILIKAWVELNGDKGVKNRNWGDDINYYFFNEITDKNVKIYDKIKHIGKHNYLCIGTILNNAFLTNNSIVWGSGIEQDNIKFFKKPKEVCAVRGPLTRKVLLKNNINCPEIYGDPALLLPYHYKPQNIEKKYKYGIIPHFTNVNDASVNKFKNNKDVLIINLSNYKKWTDIIDDIISCENIISESLHGLIVSEAYGIPNIWININNNPRKNKTFFKYHDFFLSLGKDVDKPFVFSKETKINDLGEWIKTYKHVNNINLEKLIESCPFKITLKYKKSN